MLLGEFSTLTYILELTAYIVLPIKRRHNL